MYLLKDAPGPLTGPTVTLDPASKSARQRRVVAHCSDTFRAVVQSRHYGERGSREANALPIGVLPPPTHNEVWLNEAVLTDSYPETELMLSPDSGSSVVLRIVVEQLHGILSVEIEPAEQPTENEQPEQPAEQPEPVEQPEQPTT